MFCIKCGRPAEAGNFCKSCFLEKESLFEIEDFRITRCNVCGSYYQGLRKVEIGDAIKNHISTKHDILHIGISYRKKGNHIVAALECTGVIKPFRKTEKKTAEVIVRSQKCDNCTKLSGNYYEALMQVRGGNAEKIMEKIGDANALRFVIPMDSGYDVKFVNKQDAGRIAGTLKEFDVKRTAKLVGEKDGKKIYRVCYSIR